MYHYLLDGILVLNFAFVVAVIFFERKNPTSSLAWILVLTFVPMFGFFLYLFLGSGFRFNKRKKFRRKSAADDDYEDALLDELRAQNRELFLNDRHQKVTLLEYLENEGDGCYTDDNRIEVFTDGNDMFPRLLDDIRAATKHVHLLFYIFKDDVIGDEILQALRQRAKAGVEVRLIYDGLGSLLSMGRAFHDLRKDGAEVEIFSPMFGKFTSSLNANYRNHRKIVVIDGVIGYVGGMNVGDEYMSRNPKLSPWRDTHVRMTGSAVWFLQERFLMDRRYVTGHSLHAPDAVTRYFPPAIQDGHLGVQVASGGPDTEGNPIKGALLRMFYSARKTLYIQSPYFAPDESLLDALRVAADTGVDIRLMIPGLADHKLVHKATFGYARQALEFGVRVFMYHGFLHSKTAVCDATVATIGTANLSNRSFHINFEVNLFVHDETFAAQQEAIFLHDQQNCVELTEEWFRRQPLTSRFLYNAARLIAPMI